MKVYSKILLFFLFVGLTQTVWSSVTKLNKFRFSVEPTKIRLVFDATNKINYTAKLLPKKIIIDVKQAKFTAAYNNKELTKTPISSMLSKQNGNNLRLLLNLKKPLEVKHFCLSNPHRLVIDLYQIEKGGISNDNQKPQTNSTIDDLEQDLINKIYTINNQDYNHDLRPIMVVIDPGHGGKDPGAIGANSTREKDITLAIAKKLQKMINDIKGFRAVLTRNGDYFIPLRERLGIARIHKADMFISIHADAYKHRRAHGVSIFALSQRGATSEAARWLAEKENESELGQAIADKSMLLRSVLIDLAQTATISASLEIGGKILQTLASIARLHFDRVEQAAFVVLKSPDIPSLLVEVGFLSHSAEELKLCKATYQEELAYRLAMGIQTYFVRRPPQGTYLAKIKPGFNKKDSSLGMVLPE